MRLSMHLGGTHKENDFCSTPVHKSRRRCLRGRTNVPGYQPTGGDECDWFSRASWNERYTISFVIYIGPCVLWCVHNSCHAESILLLLLLLVVCCKKHWIEAGSMNAQCAGTTVICLKFKQL